MASTLASSSPPDTRTVDAPMPGTDYILDTDVVSYIMAGRTEASVYLDLLEDHTAGISFVTVGELLRGAYQAKWGDRRVADMEHYLRDRYVVLPYTIDVSRRWARLVADCAKAGLVVGANDAWIAATALTFGCAVLARDAAFKSMVAHVPELTVLP